MNERTPGYQQWLAGNVKSAGSGFATTSPSPTPEPVADKTQFAILIDALREQTAASLKLVTGIESLILAMGQVEQEADPDAPQTHYLSGRKI